MIKPSERQTLVLSNDTYHIVDSAIAPAPATIAPATTVVIVCNAVLDTRSSPNPYQCHYYTFNIIGGIIGGGIGGGIGGIIGGIGGGIVSGVICGVIGIGISGGCDWLWSKYKNNVIKTPLNTAAITRVSLELQNV